MFASDADYKSTAEEVLASGYLFPNEFFGALSEEFGLSLDSTWLSIKKDSGYFVDREIKPTNFNYQVTVSEGTGMREAVWALGLKSQKELMVATGRTVRLPAGMFPTSKEPVYLPNAQGLENWCRDSEALCSCIRSLDGSECHILHPFILRLACEILLHLSFA